MGMKFLAPGIGNVGSYQVSGYPYVTGSVRLNDGEEHKISFPRVAKSITVINRADPEDEIKNAGPSVPTSGKSKPTTNQDLKPKPQTS